MKSMKKALAALMALSLSAMMLVACSSSESTTTTTTTESSSESTTATTTTEATAEASVWEPEYDVTIRVPAGAGGAFDIAARIFAQSVQESFDTTAMVTNIEGSNGAVASADLMQYDAAAEEMMGGNIGMFTMTPLFNPDIALDMDDYQIVCSLISDEYVILTAPGNTAITNWDEFVAYGQDNKIIVSTAAPGDTTHALMTALLTDAGVNFDIVTNDAGNQRITSVVSGDATCTIVSASLAVQFVQDGSIAPIACFNADPCTMYEGMEVPTVESFGYDYIFRTNNFIMVRAGVDQEILDQIFDAFVAYQQTDEFIAMAEESNFIPYTYDGPTTTAEIQAASDMFVEIYNQYYA